MSAQDGHTLACFVAEPAGTAKAAVVVLQEIFGVNAHIRTVCERFAAEGFLALAPALFDRHAKGIELGYDAESIAKARSVKAALSNDDALLDVAAAARHAASALRNDAAIAVIGFCWGGTLAWRAAAGVPGIASAVAYYGTQIADYLNEQPRCPVLLHFGRQDAGIPMASVERIAQAHPQAELHLYNAGHGFACDARAAFHAESAGVAAQRTNEFLGRTLGIHADAPDNN